MKKSYLVFGILCSIIVLAQSHKSFQAPNQSQRYEPNSRYNYQDTYRYVPNEMNVVESSSIHIQKNPNFRNNEIIQIRLRNQRGNFYELIGNSLFITNLIPGNYEILINRSGRITRLTYRLNPKELLSLNIDNRLRLSEMRSFDENSEMIIFKNINWQNNNSNNFPNGGVNYNYLNDYEFNLWYQNFNKNSFDTDRLSYLRTYYPQNGFNNAQVQSLMSQFSFSKEKLIAADIILSRQNELDFSLIENQFPFSSDKEKLRNIVNKYR